MSRKCPRCLRAVSEETRFGRFTRVSDKRKFQRFKCQNCSFIYSQASFQRCYRQKKRRLNKEILVLFCSHVSQRRIARILKISRTTVARKLIFLGKEKESFNQKQFNKIKDLEHIQFDDLETFEHTKCKPLSVTLAVEKETRKILNFKVSQMPAKGHLAKISVKKYGFREDKRSQARRELLEALSPKLKVNAVIESDDNPHYKPDVKKYISHAIHKTYLGKRGAIVGQGELKKTRFDPLFSLNHTFAMMRANICRLIRKTWCTTKDPRRLRDHIELYVYYHNEVLLKTA